MLENGNFVLKFVNSKSGEVIVVNKSIKGGHVFDLETNGSKTGVYWFQKI